MHTLILKVLALIGSCGFLLSWACDSTGVFYSTYRINYPCTISPSNLDFAEAFVGTGGQKSFSLSNRAILQREVAADKWITIEGVSPTLRITGFPNVQCGSQDSPFRVTGPFPVVLNRLEEHEFTAEFAPTTAGVWQCDIYPDFEVENVGYNVDYVQHSFLSCMVRVSGSAVSGPEPVCSVQPASPIHYGEVSVGSSRDLDLTITNETPDLPTTNKFRFLFENPVGDCELFTIDPADGEIGPGGTKEITVHFTPSAPGEFQCSRTLSSLKVPPDPTDPYIASPCPTEITWQGTGVASVPQWAVCQPQGTTDWHGVSGLSSSEIYVAGDGGRVLASGGDCLWPASGTIFTNVEMAGIWGHTNGTDKEIWSAGNYPPPTGQFGETGTILKSDGTIWNKVDEDGLHTYAAVWGSALDDVYFAGAGVATDFPNAKHWDGSSLSTVKISDWGMSNVSGLSGTGANDVWAVLEQGFNSVFRFQGDQWEDQTQPFMTQPLHDVWANQGSDFYAVYAVGEDGAIYHYDGSTSNPGWTDESIPGETRDFFGVWVSGTGQVFVVGEGQVIYRGHVDEPGSWTLQNVPGGLPSGDLLDVWGSSDDDIYAVGTNGVILRYQPAG